MKFLRKEAQERHTIKAVNQEEEGGKVSSNSIILFLNLPDGPFKSQSFAKPTPSSRRRSLSCALIYEFISVIFQSLVSIFACTVYIISLYRDENEPV